MAVIARYIWGKTAEGYGWNPWTEPELTLEKDGSTGHWCIYEGGTLLVICLDYRGAQRVAARLRRAELDRLTPDGRSSIALLTQTPEGWTYTGYSTAPHLLSDHGRTFPTRAEAEAFLQAQERTKANGRLH